MNWPDVDNWIDVLDHVWIGIVLIVVAAVPSVLSLRNHKSIKKVQDQVVNGHTTPMRDDIDEMRDNLRNMRTDMHFVKTELSDIRSEINLERKERLNLDHRFETWRTDH